MIATPRGRSHAASALRDDAPMLLSRLFDTTLLALVALAASLGALRKRAWIDGRGRAAWWCAAVVTALLWLSATPFVALSLVDAIEARPVASVSNLVSRAERDHAAVVVLGSSLRPPVEGVPPRERLDAAGLARALGAARVWRETHARWVIASGIAPGPSPGAVGEAMTDLLASQGVPRSSVLRETASRTTRENARYSVALGRSLGVTRWVVVTSALHLPRALKEFRDAGVEPVGAPVDAQGGSFFAPGDAWSYLLPTSWAVGATERCVHELLGRYRP